jgi:hypothetical protein
MSKGIIQVHDFDVDDLDVFKRHLKEEYNIHDIIPAPFIKSRNPESKSFIITFQQSHLPYSIYIPGERSDTIVQKFHNRPMLCSNCQEYRHPKKYCKNNTRCRKCSAIGHTMDECTSQEPLCHHCQGPHKTGDRSCPKQQREEAICEIEDRDKVGVMRARQILEGEKDWTTNQTKKYPNMFNCSMNEDQKRKLNPFLLQKILEQHLGAKPNSIRSISKTTFLIETSCPAESNKIVTLQNINNVPVQISPNTSHGTQNGLIYVYQYNMNNFRTFKEGLMKDHGLQDVTEAFWIKSSRNMQAKALLLTFRGELPGLIEIPGESMKTRVYEYVKRPYLCRKCYDYGHGKKNCNNEVRCPQCSVNGHEKEQCQQETPKCHHCSEAHLTGSNTCPRFKQEQEIIAIQSKNSVSRSQAIILFNRNNPNPQNMNYAQATKQNSIIENNPVSHNQRTENPSVNTERQTILKSPTSSSGLTQTTKVVCVNPDSGKMFTTTTKLPVHLIRRTSSAGTSETNPLIRKEARNIFNKYSDDGAADASEDLQQYEEDLRTSRKRKTSDRSRTENRREHNEKRVRSNSPQTERKKPTTDHHQRGRSPKRK